MWLSSSRVIILPILCFGTVFEDGITLARGEDDILASVILGDIFPDSSAQCDQYSTGEEQKDYYSFEYASSAKESNWNTWHGAPFESEVFLAEMRHENSDPTKAWTMRVAQAGNIYGFRGVYGEAMPPQCHKGAPWIDEVWQSVSVNQFKNRQPGAPRFFIHQAGTYMKDRPFTTRKVFYSPSLAKYCSSTERACSFAGWGQQAHVPTPHTSDALYFNRYKDCGDGVVEVSYLIYNNALTSRGKWGSLSYFNVPWAGVRTSNLQEMFLSEKNTGALRMQFPVPGFGFPEEPAPDVRDTGGFTTFAQSLKHEPKNPADSTTTDGRQICSYEDVDHTYYMPVTDGRGGARPIDVARQRHVALQRRRRQEEVDARVQRAAGNSTCTTDGDDDDDASSLPPIYDPNILRLVVRTNNACRESKPHTVSRGETIVYCEIKNAFELKTGEGLHPLIFTNPRTGASFRVRNVVHWAFSGTQLWFAPEKTKQGFAWLMNRAFRQGDEIVVSYDELRPCRARDSNALTFVHGHDAKGTINRKTPTRLRYGRVAGKRDYTVFTVNVRRNVQQTHMLVERQYLVTGKLEEAQAQGKRWVGEQQQQVILPGKHKRSHKIDLYFFPEKKVFGAEVDGKINCVDLESEKKLVCTGSSTPQTGHRAFFSIECLGSYYFGPDQYHFSPTPGDDEIVRSYVCSNRKEGENITDRPKWKLIGFFPVNECEDLREGVIYDPGVCDAPVVIKEEPSDQQQLTPLSEMNAAQIASKLTNDAVDTVGKMSSDALQAVDKVSKDALQAMDKATKDASKQVSDTMELATQQVAEQCTNARGACNIL